LDKNANIITQGCRCIKVMSQTDAARKAEGSVYCTNANVVGEGKTLPDPCTELLSTELMQAIRTREQ